jgi:hypothetical protein
MRFLSALFRIALTAAIINASARVGFAYWSFYQLKDHAQQTVLFGGEKPTDVLQAGVLDKASQLLLPVATDQVVVTRSGPRTSIQAQYVQSVEYFPRQQYPVKFSFEVEGFTLGGTPAP